MIHLPTMDLHKLFAGGCFFHLSSILFSQRTGHSDSPKHWFRSTQTCTECLTGNFREKKTPPEKETWNLKVYPPWKRRTAFKIFKIHHSLGSSCCFWLWIVYLFFLVDSMVDSPLENTIKDFHHSPKPMASTSGPFRKLPHLEAAEDDEGFGRVAPR